MAVRRKPHTIDLLHQLETALRGQLELAFRPYDITPGQYAVLTSLWGSSGLSASQLARRAEVRPQSVNEMVIALVAKGLVEREEDADNRRVLRVKLSAKGRRVLRAADAASDGLERDLLSAFAPGDAAALDIWLQTMLTTLLEGPPQQQQPDLFAALMAKPARKAKAKA